MTLESLPDDIAALRAMLMAQGAELDAQQAELTELRQTIRHRELYIEKLKLQLAKLRRMQFGRSSEKLEREIEQLELLIEELETPSPAVARAPLPETTRPARRALPEHLPREAVIHSPACSCPSCGGALRPAGEDVAEMLEYIPEHWKVVRHVRPKMACDACSKIVQADAPSRPIARGLAGPGLLAHVLVSKYCDHLPLYRQSEIYARSGVGLERSTLGDWVGECAALLGPLVDRLGAHVLGGRKLHADDTPVPVLAPGLGKTKLGRLWTYVRDDRPAGDVTPPAVFFRYSPDRKGDHPRRHLQSFRGTLQADAYAGFHHLYDTGTVVEAACWAHARRKFFDLHKAQGSPIAKEALDRIGALYEIEAAIRGKPPDERRDQRRSRAGPLLADFRAWLIEARGRVSAKSEMANAIQYATSRWAALTRYWGSSDSSHDSQR